MKSIPSTVRVTPNFQSTVDVSVGATAATLVEAVRNAVRTAVLSSQLATRGAMLAPLTDASGAAFTVGSNLPLYVFR